VDFDDLLVYTARLLEDNPTVRDKYAKDSGMCWWTNFRIPTWQQYALVKHLASQHKNIFLCG